MTKVNALPPVIRPIGLSDLRQIQVRENGERFVPVDDADVCIIKELPARLKLPSVYSSVVLFCRESVAEKLARANAFVKKHRPTWTIKVCYAYRPPCLQNEYFEQRKHELQRSNPSYGKEVLDELVHTFIAFPPFAGHPTGGAVDVTIVDTSTMQELDFGSNIHDFSDTYRMSWLCKFLTPVQSEARLVLFEAMTNENFAPFWGEWWHYSYGDREWAAYYGRSSALYSSTEWNIVERTCDIHRQSNGRE